MQSLRRLNALSISNSFIAAGVFILLLVGLTLSVVLAVFELTIFVYRSERLQKQQSPSSSSPKFCTLLRSEIAGALSFEPEWRRTVVVTTTNGVSDDVDDDDEVMAMKLSPPQQQQQQLQQLPQPQQVPAKLGNGVKGAYLAQTQALLLSGRSSGNEEASNL